MKRAHLLVMAFIATPLLTLAQVTPADSLSKAGTVNGQKVGEKISTLEFVMKGGVFLIPIILLLIYTIYLVIERYKYINRMSNYNSSVLPEIKSHLEKGDVNAALSVTQREANATNVVLSEGILTVGRPTSEIESNMEKVVNIEVAKMEKSLGHLGLIAAIAPTFGFIGTIAGVIKIFYNISISENVSIGNISGGLYEKMISSGAGLIVGLVAYSGYHLLNSKIDKYILNIQNVMLRFVNIIQRPDKWQ